MKIKHFLKRQHMPWIDIIQSSEMVLFYLALGEIENWNVFNDSPEGGGNAIWACMTVAHRANSQAEEEQVPRGKGLFMPWIWIIGKPHLSDVRKLSW